MIQARHFPLFWPEVFVLDLDLRTIYTTQIELKKASQVTSNSCWRCSWAQLIRSFWLFFFQFRQVSRKVQLKPVLNGLKNLLQYFFRCIIEHSFYMNQTLCCHICCAIFHHKTFLIGFLFIKTLKKSFLFFHKATHICLTIVQFILMLEAFFKIRVAATY